MAHFIVNGSQKINTNDPPTRAPHRLDHRVYLLTHHFALASPLHPHKMPCIWKGYLTESIMQKSRKNAPILYQVFIALLFFCGLYGAVNLWSTLFPPSMTYRCAYLLNEYPTEFLGVLDQSTREEVLDCLYLERRYGQERWVPRGG